MTKLGEVLLENSTQKGGKGEIYPKGWGVDLKDAPKIYFNLKQDIWKEDLFEQVDIKYSFLSQ